MHPLSPSTTANNGAVAIRNDRDDGLNTVSLNRPALRNRLTSLAESRTTSGSLNTVPAPFVTVPVSQAAGLTSASVDYVAELEKVTLSIRQPLMQVEQLIAQQLTSPIAEVAEILSYVATLGGKRLRPALTLLSAQACGTITEETIRLAAVVELVHTATLVHDDVLDNADTRRHHQTVHRKWNRQISILAGDWLFTQAYSLANQGTSTLPGRWIASAAKEVCEGEIRQNLTAGSFNMPETEYLSILASKTGSLCGVSCSMGAWSAGLAETDCKAFYDYGLNLGLAFQVHDDWLDYWGNAEKIGKPVGGDFLSAKPTMPLLRTLDIATPAHRAELFDAFEMKSMAGFAKVCEIFEHYDAGNYTRLRARQLSEQAITFLQGSINQARDYLQRLAIAAVARNA